MITAKKMREITQATLRAEEKEINERVNDYAEGLVSQAVIEAKKGERHYTADFNLPVTLWEKVYWRLAKAGYAAYYLDTNEIDIWW